MKRQKGVKDHLAALSLFNEKTEKLKRCSFTRLVFEQDSGVSLSARLNDEIKINRFGPGEESIDAFALTIRYFIQNNERISFRNLAEIYSDLPISQLEKDLFSNARKELNSYLDAFSLFTVNNERLSNRHILDVFMYGGLSHANEEKKIIYDAWMTNPLLRQYLENEFIFIMGNVMNVISYIQTLNTGVIKELTKTKQGI